MRNSIITAGLFFLTVSSLQAGIASWTPAELTKIRKTVTTSPEAAQWAKSIQKSAEAALSETPHPIANIQTAGKLKGSVEKTETEEAFKDLSRLKFLEWGYVLTGRNDFKQKAEAYLTAWAKVCQPPGNPIDGTNLEAFIETYDLLRADMTPADQALMDEWLRKIAATLFASDDIRKKSHQNNWQAHRLKIIGMAAFTLGDAAMEQQVLDEFKDLLQVNLNADGSTYDFLERDALHYHVYDLEPMVRTAMLYERAQALDLYHWKTEQGASIANCVAFLIPYVKGEKTHAEFVKTQVKFDIQRAENHEKGHTIGENFEPKAGEKCLELAQYFEPDLTGLVATLAAKPNNPYPTLQVLFNENARGVDGALGIDVNTDKPAAGTAR